MFGSSGGPKAGRYVNRGWTQISDNTNLQTTGSSADRTNAHNVHSTLRDNVPGFDSRYRITGLEVTGAVDHIFTNISLHASNGRSHDRFRGATGLMTMLGNINSTYFGDFGIRLGFPGNNFLAGAIPPPFGMAYFISWYESAFNYTPLGGNIYAISIRAHTLPVMTPKDGGAFYSVRVRSSM